MRHRFGAFGRDVARGLTLRHDHGSQFISGDFQNEIRLLGITASPSYVREPQGNGIAERFVRILKENLLWVRRFRTVRSCDRPCWPSRKPTTPAGGWAGTATTPAQVRARQRAAMAKAAGILGMQVSRKL